MFKKMCVYEREVWDFIVSRLRRWYETLTPEACCRRRLRGNVTAVPPQ